MLQLVLENKFSLSALTFQSLCCGKASLKIRGILLNLFYGLIKSHQIPPLTRGAFKEIQV